MPGIARRDGSRRQVNLPGSVPVRHQRVDLNLLVALELLLAERSVTKAAERLCVTQSAMSGMLSRLRDCFGDPLLVPVGRSMQLTPRAERLIEPVRDILLRVDSTLGLQLDFDPATAQRRFVIIASDYVSEVLVGDVLRRVASQAPGLAFEVRPMAGSLGHELDNGHVDFLVTPAHLALPEHPQTLLFEDSYHVIACAGYDAVRDGISLAQFSSLGHVVYQNARSGNPWFELWYANSHGPARRVEVVTHGFTLLPRFIAGTRRIATVQTRLAMRFGEHMGVRMLPPPFETPRLTEVLQWHRYRDDDPGVRWVRDRIVEVAQEMPPI